MNNNWYPQYPNHPQHPHQPDHQQQQWQDNWQDQGCRNHPQSHPQQQQMPTWNRQVSIEEAMSIALDQVPGQIVKVELEHENGILVYEIEIVTQQGVKYEVDVDVNTGGIVSIKLD